MPIIAMIVLCVTGRARGGGLFFLIGWLVSIMLFMVFAVLFLSNLRDGAPEKVSIFAIVFQTFAAGFFFWVSWQNWVTRPRKGQEAPVPKWISGFSHLSRPKLFGMGFIMNYTNVKNLPIMITAGLAISKGAEDWMSGFIAASIFTLVASLSIIIPWLMSIFGSEATHKSIEHARIWLYRNNNIIMAVLFFYMGITVLSAAIVNIGEYLA